jgi:hypothetical protein
MLEGAKLRVCKRDSAGDHIRYDSLLFSQSQVDAVHHVEAVT